MSVPIHKFFSGAAWALIVFGPLLTLSTLVDLLSTPGGLSASAPQAFVSLAVGLVSPVVSGGVLLVLLSIDRRLGNKG